MLHLDQDVGQNNGGGEILSQGCGIEPEVVVVRIRIEEKYVRQALLGDKTLEIAHVGIADARGAAADHVEPGNLVGLMALADVEELANADGQRKALAARSVL